MVCGIPDFGQNYNAIPFFANLMLRAIHLNTKPCIIHKTASRPLNWRENATPATP